MPRRFPPRILQTRQIVSSRCHGIVSRSCLRANSHLEDKDRRGNKLVRTEKPRRPWDWLFVVVRVLHLQLDVGSHQNLKFRFVRISGAITRNPVLVVRGRIHGVVAHDPNQPWISPVFRLKKPAREGYGSGRPECRPVSIQLLVIVVTALEETPKLEPVTELVIECNTRTVERHMNR